MSPLIWDALQPLVNLEKLVTGTDVVLFETPNLGLTNMAFAGRSVLPLPCLILLLLQHDCQQLLLLLLLLR